MHCIFLPEVKGSPPTMALPSPAPDSYALITGASQGIGEAMARDLASHGHNVILIARRKEALQSLVDEFVGNYGIDALSWPADLSKEPEVDEVIAKMAETKIHIIINSPGIATFGAFMDQDWNYETDQFHLSATAVHRLTRAALEQMLPRKSGAICNVGSAAGNVPIPYNSTYVFTKAGVNAFRSEEHTSELQSRF